MVKKPIRYSILGVQVHALTMDGAATAIISAAKAQRKASYVTKPYVEFFTGANRDKAITSVLNDGMLCLPDGVSTQWASAYLYGGKRSTWRAFSLAASIVLRPTRIRSVMPEKFGGATFSRRLLEQCATEGCSIYLIGSPKNSTIEKTAAFLKTKIPKLHIVGTWPGELEGFRGLELRQKLAARAVESDLAKDLKRTKPDIILVGMGFPLQEELIAKLTAQLDHGVLIGEGGTFDYDSFGGHLRRAPKWVQHIGLEWAWRLSLDPKRLKRQLAIPRFMYAIWRQSRQIRE